MPDDPATLNADCYEAVNIQVDALMRRIEATRAKSLILGISGGLDSTHALLVACIACDRLGLPRSTIRGYTMPGFGTSEGTRSNAWKLMEAIGVTAEEIETVIGPLAAPGEGALRSPGMLARHYAPATPLRLDASEAQPGEVLLGFGPNARSAERNLSPLGNLAEAAANLFAMLRELDAENHAGIAVSRVPDYGLGRAINDRLRRAASSAAAF